LWPPKLTNDPQIKNLGGHSDPPFENAEGNPVVNFIEYTTQNLLRITFSTVRYFCVFVINMKIDFKELNISCARCTWQINNLMNTIMRFSYRCMVSGNVILIWWWYDWNMQCQKGDP